MLAFSGFILIADDLHALSMYLHVFYQEALFKQ